MLRGRRGRTGPAAHRARPGIGRRRPGAALRAFIANVAERDYERGEALHSQALAQWQRLGNQHVINGGIYNLAICAFNGRRWAEALERVAGVIATARAHDDWELGAARHDALWG